VTRDEHHWQVFRLGFHPFCLPSRVWQWHERQIVYPYGGATVPGFHGIPYSLRVREAPTTIRRKDSHTGESA